MIKEIRWIIRRRSSSEAKCKTFTQKQLHIFHPDHHPERLENFLSEYLGTPVKIKQVLPREGIHLTEKGSFVVMDIIVELSDGSIMDVEMQKRGYDFPGERSNCYVADMVINATLYMIDEMQKEIDEKTQELDEKTQELDEKTQELDEKTQELDEQRQELDEKTRELANNKELIAKYEALLRENGITL